MEVATRHPTLASGYLPLDHCKCLESIVCGSLKPAVIHGSLKPTGRRWLKPRVKIQLIRFPSYGQECRSMSPGDVVLSLVVPTGTVLIHPVLSCHVHGDSLGAGSSSGYGHWSHSQSPSSPVAEVEAVAEGPCHAMNGPQLPSLVQGGLLVPVFSTRGLLITPEFTPWIFSRAPELPAPPWPPTVCSMLDCPVLLSCSCMSRWASRAGRTIREGGDMLALCRVCHLFPSCVLIWFDSCPRLVWLSVHYVPAVCTVTITIP